MSKKIFIVGGNSVLAQDVIKVLSSSNEVVAAPRDQFDISREPSMPGSFDVAINFAASFGGNSNKEILTAVETNAVGALKVCMAAKEAGIKHVILISSAYALLEPDSPFFSIYSLTKKQGDELAEYYCRQNTIRLTILRPSRVYGDNDAYAKHQPFFYEIIRRARTGEDIELFGQNDAIRNYIHAADIAGIISQVVDKQLEGIYSCFGREDTTYSQLAKSAQKIFGKGGSVRFLPDKPDIPDDDFPRGKSIYEKIDLTPVVTVEEGIKRIKKYQETQRQ